MLSSRFDAVAALSVTAVALCGLVGCDRRSGSSGRSDSPNGRGAKRPRDAAPVPEAEPARRGLPARGGRGKVAKGDQASGPDVRAVDAGALAKEILSAAGVKGGLVVHVGCGDGRLTAALFKSGLLQTRPSTVRVGVDRQRRPLETPLVTMAERRHAEPLVTGDGYLVHGLDADSRNVEKAREHLLSLGVYGSVSADSFSGDRLPYVDNLVNLVVSEELGEVPMDEVMRVLCPNGVAYIMKKGNWEKTVKPRPKEIDEWTHYMHDASNNAVAHDSVVGPLSSLQWVGSPRWARHHDRMASTSALVSSGGRIFYIFDEGPTSSILLPPRWKLIARDAFNGTVLWKRRIGKWFTHLWPLKSGPAVLPRRLVAERDTVFVTLGIDAPVTALDAATGRTVRTYEGTGATEEILCSDGVLFLVVDKGARKREYTTLKMVSRNVNKPWWAGEKKQIMAVRAGSGEVAWQKEYPVIPLTLAADDSRVLFHDGGSIVCLDRTDGRELWRSNPVPRVETVYSFFAPTLVVHDGVVLFAGGEYSGLVKSTGGARKADTMTALSAETGRVLWQAPHPASGYSSPEDLFVAGGLVWTGEASAGGLKGAFTGRDVRTGKVQSEFKADVSPYWFHHRCHPGKATDRYVLTSRTGIEFIDLEKKHWTAHHWARGGCVYGIMPCNGLVYTPPHPCACYLESKQYGFNALAPVRPGGRVPRDVPDAGRLERGPAYGQIGHEPSQPGDPDDWPTYRHDAARSGFTKASLPAGLERAWQTDLGGRLSSVVIAEGRLFVASIDTHTVHALDASDGKRLWSCTTGGRVDSPPTIHQGTAIFGSADGWVYCVRTSDGELVWRFRAAPEDRRLTAFEQLESVWPVPGSVLVQDGVVYCVAGRSMFLDGGLRLLRLDPLTGRKIGEKVLDELDPTTGEDLHAKVKWLNMPVALPDVLSGDGRHIYMRSQRFDEQGDRHELGPQTRDRMAEASRQSGEGRHLFCPTGFLDDTWFHRSYWLYGKTFCSGWSGYYLAGKFTPAGRLLVVDDARVYGFGRKPRYYRWTIPMEYRLFAIGKDAEPVGGEESGSGPVIRVNRSRSLNPTNTALTVEAWVNARARSGVILARGGSTHGYALLLRDGAPRFVVRANLDMRAVTAKRTAMGKWVHLAGVLTADRGLRLYVDGQLVGSGTAASLITTDPGEAMAVGVDEESAVDHEGSSFAGLIDEIRVYHRALERAEIRKHAAAAGRRAGALSPRAARPSVGHRRSRTQAARPPAKDAGLVLYYSFDSGDARDDSGNGNNGTVHKVTSVAGRFGKAMRFGSAGPVAGDRWEQDVPMLVRAMVLADGTLFIAGPPDLVDEAAAVGRLDDAGVRAKLEEQDAALQARRGALLWAVSAADGTKLAEYKLNAPPAWDGMAAAAGRLYLSTADGKVVCLSGR